MQNLMEKIDAMTKYIAGAEEANLFATEVEIEKVRVFYRGQRWALASLLYELNGSTGLTALELCEASAAKLGLVGV